MIEWAMANPGLTVILTLCLAFLAVCAAITLVGSLAAPSRIRAEAARSRAEAELERARNGQPPPSVVDLLDGQ